MQGQTDILVIDDDRDLVETVQIALESKGFDVRKAFNGKEGLAEIQKKPPDLIVLDVMMSTDTEGFDLAYKLKNNPRYDNIPIVMVTGFTRKMMEERSRAIPAYFGGELARFTAYRETHRP